MVDLTKNFTGERFAPEILREEMPLKSGMTSYTGIVYTIKNDGMTGTYIDFPGHIAETDDGMRGDNCPLEKIFRVPAQVIRMDRESGSGAVTADDLERACGGKVSTPALVINALGCKEPFEIESRSVYLDDTAVEWIIQSKCYLLVSDIYESRALHGVFLKLFAAGVSTVCHPAGLRQLPAGEVRLSVLFPLINVTQLPCRLVAEF